MAKAKKITTSTAVTYEIDVDPRSGILDFDSRQHEDGDKPWAFVLQKITTTTAHDGRGERYGDGAIDRETIDILSADQVATLVKTAAEKLTWPINTANRNLAHDRAENPAVDRPGVEYTVDIDTVVDCGPKGEKGADRLEVGDVFKDFGDSDDEWKRVVADDLGEGDTVILRVVDAPSPVTEDDDEDAEVFVPSRPMRVIPADKPKP